jgi:hypothetical protein
LKPDDDLDMRFTSDDHWEDFIDGCEERWASCTNKIVVIGDLTGREDIAKAAWASANANYLVWFGSPNKSIGGQRPMDLLVSGVPYDEDRLRALLMQQPP